MKKLLLINFLLLAVIFTVSEFFIYNKFFRFEKSFIPDYSYRDDFKIYDDARVISGSEYNNEPVLLLGCSYTYGHGLAENETFSAQLSEKTKRPVYNWGQIGNGLFHNILKLREPYNQKFITKGKPKYIIYTYMFDQTLRMSYLQNSIPYFTRVMYYARKNNLIPNQKFIPFIDRFYTVQFIRDKFWNDYLFNNQKFDDINVFFDYLKFLFLTMKSETDKLFPESEFIVLIYDENMDDIYELHKNFYEKLFKSDRWKELGEYGIKTVSTKELLGFEPDNNYMLKSDTTTHPQPSAKAWEVIVPELTKRYNL